MYYYGTGYSGTVLNAIEYNTRCHQLDNLGLRHEIVVVLVEEKEVDQGDE